MKAMKILFFFSYLSMASVLFAADTSKWLTQRHTVVSVPAWDRIVIQYQDLPITVRLAQLKAHGNINKTRDFLANLLNKQSINIVPEDALGLSAEGLPQVYVFLKQQKDAPLLINEELLRQGLAEFSDGGSEKFVSILDKMRKTAADVPPPADYKEAGELVGELNSKLYHKTTCKWAAQMTSRIAYDNFEAAEKAGKQPCSLCLFDRVKDLRTSAGAQKGNEIRNIANKIVGLKSDDFYYSPVAKKVTDAPLADIILFDSLQEAQDSGRKPDPGSLRIDNPAVPAPEGDECIGRGLPYFRPCRRPAEKHPTGLCEPCRNGRIR